MKTTYCVIALLAVGLVAISGCKKAEQVQTPEAYGVKVDLPKLDTVFVGADEQVQASVGSFRRCIRYRQFPQALAELGKLASQPALTEAQKKLVSDLTEQTKEVMAKATAAPVPGR